MYNFLSEPDEKVETENEDEDETKERHMNQDELVKGAIESAFWAMDRLILRDKQQYRISGGACTLVALFIFDKLYLANAGDSRAVCYIPSVSFAWCILRLRNNFFPMKYSKTKINLFKAHVFVIGAYGPRDVFRFHS